MTSGFFFWPYNCELTIFAFMETIPRGDCEKIGFIRKTHGVHGQLVLEYEPHFEVSVEETSRFFIELEGLLVPFFIKDEGLRFKSANSAIVTLDWVESENYARRLVGQEVYLFTDEIVDESKEEAESKFLGFILFDSIKGEIGIINQVDDYSGNVVFTANFNNEDVLIPYNEELLISINEKNKTITLKLPEGLF